MRAPQAQWRRPATPVGWVVYLLVVALVAAVATHIATAVWDWALR